LKGTNGKQNSEGVYPIVLKENLYMMSEE